MARSTVFFWQQKYREGGLATLSTKFASGRPTTLSDRQVMRLYALIIGNDPRQLGFGPALWTRRMIADLIRQQFDVHLSLVTVGRILRKLGMSPQRPVVRAYQQDPERVRRWKREEYPAIRAEAQRVGAPILFADESAVRSDYHAGTTWAPVGRTPVVVSTGARLSVHMISATGARGDLHFLLLDGTLTGAVFVEFLQKLLHDVAGTVFLILDGHPAHRANLVKEFVASTNGRLRLFFLPPYSPELNPDEWVWKNVKHDQVGRAAVLDRGQLREAVTGALQRLQQLPSIVRGFFTDPHLAYLTA